MEPRPPWNGAGGYPAGAGIGDDLDGMVKRRFVRALVVYSKTFYFVDRGRERGLIADLLWARWAQPFRS